MALRDAKMASLADKIYSPEEEEKDEELEETEEVEGSKKKTKGRKIRNKK